VLLILEQITENRPDVDHSVQEGHNPEGIIKQEDLLMPSLKQVIRNGADLELSVRAVFS
jgi:hypothetical protein